MKPFNYYNTPESDPFSMRYIRSGDHDPEFAAFFRKSFEGRPRLIVKDVHSLFALDWIDHQIAPHIVVISRHPLSVADSWHRVFKGDDEERYSRFLNQPMLVKDYLYSFEAHIRSCSTDFWGRMGAYWGACYHVVMQQQRNHSNWIVVRHEDFCEDPTGRFRDLFALLDLEWTEETQQRIELSNADGSQHHYLPRRILAAEKEKWRKNLTTAQANAVIRAVAPFQVPIFSI